MVSNISLAPLGHFGPFVFFKETCPRYFINAMFGLSFYLSVPLLHTPNERDSFSHSGEKKLGFETIHTLILILTQPLTELMS